MIDWKEDYKWICKILLALVVVFILITLTIDSNFKRIRKQLNEKDEQIWQLETQVEDLKEQIHILENVRT